jgi:hypothetical protein
LGAQRNDLNAKTLADIAASAPRLGFAADGLFEVGRHRIPRSSPVSESVGESARFSSSISGWCRSVCHDLQPKFESVQVRCESLTAPSEAASHHEALNGYLRVQVQNAEKIAVKVDGLVRDEELLAQVGGTRLQDDYQRHRAEFFQFIETIEPLERPLLDHLIRLRLQLKPDFELAPVPRR